MFDRKMYKTFARKQLKGRWKIPVLSTLFIGFIIILFEIPVYILSSNSSAIANVPNFSTFQDILKYYETVYSAVPPVVRIFNYISVIVSVILSMAFIHLLLKITASPEPVTFNDLIEGFNLWFRAIVAYIWNFIWIFLWSLLFIIPGIVKAIAYSQTIYIVAEYPNISIPQAMKMSIAMTRGHKADLFIMYLSFLGWICLSIITLGIGLLWLIPYMQTSLLNAYRAMKKMAVDCSILNVSDFQK